MPKIGAAGGDASAANQALIIAALQISRATNQFIDNTVFDDDPTSETSDSYDANAHRLMLLEIKVTPTASPTDLLIELEFSDDDITFYKYMEGPFGDLRYEDAAGSKLESLLVKLAARYVRIKVIAGGTDGTNKFNVTIKGSFI